MKGNKFPVLLKVSFILFVPLVSLDNDTMNFFIRGTLIYVMT
jgi:hypothetical protein